MGAFSVLYITAAVTLFKLDFGDPSLVYANILNLSVRIMYSVHFVTSFYERRKARHVLRWSTIIPPWSLVLSASVSWIVIKLYEVRFGIVPVSRASGISLKSIPVLIHVGIGASMAFTCFGIWWMSFGRYLRFPEKSKIQ